jgi:hypothetical protein
LTLTIGAVVGGALAQHQQPSSADLKAAHVAEIVQAISSGADGVGLKAPGDCPRWPEARFDLIQLHNSTRY